MADDTLIIPEWPAPPGVRALQTTRATGPLATIRTRFALPAEPSWLTQVHGAAVAFPDAGAPGGVADAAVAAGSGVVLAVKTADCLPVLFCADDGSCVAAAHAGWRGLAAGVLEATIGTLPASPDRLLAWLGPAIGQPAFEVGPEVRDAFIVDDPGAASAFVRGAGDRWHADLVALARRRLALAGITRVSGGRWCTHADPVRFDSYRRDGETGRMATLVWLEPT